MGSDLLKLIDQQKAACFMNGSSEDRRMVSYLEAHHNLKSNRKFELRGREKVEKGGNEVKFLYAPVPCDEYNQCELQSCTKKNET